MHVKRANVIFCSHLFLLQRDVYY